MKNNIGPDSTGLAFRIEPAIVSSTAGPLQTSCVVWDPSAVTISADEVIRTSRPEQRSALRDAEEWLEETLTEAMPIADLHGMAEDAGISRKTLRRASESLRIVKQKTGMKGGWMWSLAPKMPKQI